MSRRRGPGAPAITLAIFAALTGGALVFAVLWSMARPPHMRARLDRLEAAIQQVQSRARQPMTGSVYLAHALCRSPPATAAELVRTELVRAAVGARLNSAQVILAPTTMADASERTFPVLFTVQATDRYDLVLGFLQKLAAAEPQVFADTIDLASRTSAVSLKLTGRVVCEPTS